MVLNLFVPETEDFHTVPGNRCRSAVVSATTIALGRQRPAWQRIQAHLLPCMLQHTAHLTHRTNRQWYLFLKGTCTYISPGKGAQQLVFLPGISLGRYEIKDNLQLAAGQEPALEELPAGSPDAQLADGLGALLLRFGRQRLLERQPDSLRKEDHQLGCNASKEEKDGELFSSFLLELRELPECSRARAVLRISMTKSVLFIPS